MTTDERPRQDKRDALIGANIAKFRRLAGMSQAALAEKLEERGLPLAQSAIAKVELGKRSLRATEAVEIAAILGTDLNALFGSPLEEAITRLRRLEAEAGRTVERATEDMNRAKEGYTTLWEIKRAVDGETVNWGPSPEFGGPNAFRMLKWPEISAILSELGVPTAQISRLERSFRAPKSRGDTFMRALWNALHAAVPTLVSEPE
ncbi:helix-turn-helix domain-containing protein [Sanguibacter sp. HDW7]|uniref:helix-turn-helix domain-containing protein n=1 Tax=Sanguibacter sp. HDW7 TaxID=2714931 RepID=UPI00140B61B0|nr:helix-turn-helix transcriptional regulator [Sanguibacter sp. HDW7]QIK82635.1 helix-turn-helix transcriptional regulator [Sanguibacter sp. HDW7]